MTRCCTQHCPPPHIRGLYTDASNVWQQWCLIRTDMAAKRKLKSHHAEVSDLADWQLLSSAENDGFLLTK